MAQPHGPLVDPPLGVEVDAAIGLAGELVATWGNWGPSLAPDGSRVAFVSDRRGIPELWVQDCVPVVALPEPAVMPGPTGPTGPTGVLTDEADALYGSPLYAGQPHSTAVHHAAAGHAAPVVVPLSPDPVLAVHWSADGQWLACAVATDGGVRSQIWVVRPDGTGRRQVAGSRSQHATLGPWTRSGHRLAVSLPPAVSGRQTCCVLIDPATGVHEPLAEGDLLTVLDLSSDERFLMLRDGTRGAEFCVVVDREADDDHPLLPYPHTGSTDVGLLRRSPPDEDLPMIAYLVTDAGLPRRVLIAQPVGPDGRRAPAGVFAERDDAELELLDSDEDGRLLALVWNVAGASEVELMDTATRQRWPVESIPAPVVSGCALSRDGSRLMLCLEGPDRPRELWSLDTAALTRPAPGDPRPGAVPSPPRLLHPVVAGGFEVLGELVRPTLETFLAHDGLPLSGWLYRAPAGPDGPGPAMLSLHGGPEGQERPTFSPQHQALLAAGITVFAPNVRGSAGFGRAFVHADDRYGRHDAIADVASSARFLIEHGHADRHRIAVTGRSYGGYLTLAALVHFPDLFAAGVDICGMSDLLTFYRDSEPWIAAAAVTKYGDPVHDRELLQDISPLAKADRIAVPLLVVHGEHDTNVPIGEAHQIVAALRRLGRPVEYLELEGEGHEYRQAISRMLLIERMIAFLTEHLNPSAG